MPFPDTVSAPARAALADVVHRPYWLDRADRPAPRPALTGDISADLVVVGGGLSGLWTAYEARRRFPDWSVVLLEGQRIAEGASLDQGDARSLLDGFQRRRHRRAATANHSDVQCRLCISALRLAV